MFVGTAENCRGSGCASAGNFEMSAELSDDHVAMTTISSDEKILKVFN